MLERVKLTNVALFEQQEIEFNDGFNCLLGETGAGKSIIIDALSFVVGAKSDKLLIRNGKDFVRVEAVFSGLSDVAVEYLKSIGVDDFDPLIISRTLNINGRNDIRIAGLLQPLGVLKELGNMLISVYGQHENISLLNDKNHISILDNFIGDQCRELKNKLYFNMAHLNEIDNSISQLGGNAAQREREADLLKYSINEIEKANLKIGEDEELAKTITKMSSTEKISESLNAVIEMIEFGALSVPSTLKQASREVRSLEKYDDKYDDVAGRLEAASIDLADIVSELKDDISSNFYDQNALENLISREQQIKKLKRKYGATIEEVLQYLDDCKSKYDLLENAEYEISKLEKQKAELLDECKSVCKQMTDLRVTASKVVERKVVEELCSLGMKNTTFKIDISPKDENFSQTSFNANGQDNVKFLFSANLGQDVKSLSKTISGGEMSRFMLAIKTVLNSEDGLMIFDEVDAGISGQIAISVAQKLARLSKTNQVLCISHLPQVCSMADSFYKVCKQTKDGQTYSSVSCLVGDDIVKELAAMGFGENITGTAFDYAKDLLLKNGDYKMSLNKNNHIK